MLLKEHYIGDVIHNEQFQISMNIGAKIVGLINDIDDSYISYIANEENDYESRSFVCLTKQSPVNNLPGYSLSLVGISKLDLDGYTRHIFEMIPTSANLATLFTEPPRSSTSVVQSSEF